MSTAAATTNSRLGSSIRRHGLWPAHLLPKPPPRQIPIDRGLSTQSPRVPSWEAFGRRPSSRADRSRLAGIRNPHQTGPPRWRRALTEGAASGRSEGNCNSRRGDPVLGLGVRPGHGLRGLRGRVEGAGWLRRSAFNDWASKWQARSPRLIRAARSALLSVGQSRHANRWPPPSRAYQPGPGRHQQQGPVP